MIPSYQQPISMLVISVSLSACSQEPSPEESSQDLGKQSPCQGQASCYDASPDLLERDMAQPDQAPDPLTGMVVIPEGTFIRGTRYEDDNSAALWGHAPDKAIFLSEYAIDIHEVTVAQYKVCVEQGECTAPQQDYTKNPGYNWLAPDRELHPVNAVSWFQAKAYYEWTGKSLPTEAQWEKAARGPDATIYPWGNEPLATCDRAIIGQRYTHESGCGTGYTWPIGSRPLGVSIYGIHDLAGNVAEWCSDYFDRNYYSASEYRDPQGHAEGDYRSVRGAHFAESPVAVFPYSSQREAEPPDTGLS